VVEFCHFPISGLSPLTHYRTARHVIVINHFGKGIATSYSPHIQ